MKLVTDERLIIRLQLAGSVAIVIALVIGLGAFFIAQDQAEYRATAQAAEALQLRHRQERLIGRMAGMQNSLATTRNHAEQILRARIREQVDQAHASAEAIWRREHTHRPPEEVRQLVVAALRDQRFFGGRGYFFIDDLSGTCILLPISPEREGTSLWDNQDNSGLYIMRDLIGAAHRPVGEGYATYRWFLPERPELGMTDKIAYVRLFEPFDWIIGSGDYLPFVEDELRQETLLGLRAHHGDGDNDDDYTAVIADDGTLLVWPAIPAEEGKNLRDLPDGHRQIAQRLLDQGHQGNGFARYDWQRPGNDRPLPKLSYVSRIPDWGWTLITGSYLDDLQSDSAAERDRLRQTVQRKKATTLAVLTLGIVLSLAFTLVLSRRIKRLLERYREDLDGRNKALQQATRDLFLINYLMDNSSEMIFLTDADWTLTYANTSVFDTLGWQREQMIGQPLNRFAQPPAGHEKIDGGDRRYEASLHRADGRQILAEVSSKELSYEGQLYHFAVARDITDRQRRDADLARKTLELQRSNAELEAFAYVASHDLRQPLRMVSSFLGLLERRLKGRLDDEAGEFLNFARDGARRMDRMIIDLLDYSRVGRLNKGSGPVSLSAAVDSAQANLQLALEETGGKISVSGALPVIWGSTDELTRLFQNLLGNALKYRSPDRTPDIRIAARRDGDHWLLSVSDNGIGIAAEFHERIFGLFQRLHAGDQYEGTGIGLAICRKVVEHHGGRLWVESVPGQGSTFLFTLPEGSPPNAEPMAPTAAEPART